MTTIPTVASEAAHAFLAPSAAARWVACPGSALMESRYPEAGDKAAAAEGEAAHWCFAQMLDGWAPDMLLLDGKTDKGHPIDREMLDGAQLLVDDIRATLAPYAVKPVVEQRVAIPRVHPSANWGTPDARAWASYVAAREVFLFLWDYKYGHKHVEVFENWQLMDYAAGLLDEARAMNVEEDRIIVVMRVVQPRSYHRDGPVREWRTTAAGLRDYIFRLSMAAEEALQPAPVCKPQPDACENCTARHACEALQRAAYRGMDLAKQAQASELSPGALGLEMRYLTDASSLMKARLTGLMAQAEGMRLRGESIPYWRAESSAAREQWTVTDREAIVMGSILGVDLAKEPEAVTPTQARALAKRHGVDASLIGVYASRPSGGLKLVPDDGSEARKVFAKTV